MSRLPRLHSSPDRSVAGPSMSSTTITLKRKAAISEDDEEAMDQPRKLPAIGRGPNRPLQPNRTAANLTSSRSTGLGARSLTRPQPPNLSTSRSTTRGTSAPPSSSVSSRNLYSSTRQPVKPSASRRDPPGRAVSGPATRNKSDDDKKIQDIANKVDTWQSMHGNKLAGLEADMAAERAKVSELEANHNFLRKQLDDAKAQELLKQRELSNVSEEIEALKKRHARELKDLEYDIKREVTAAKDELVNVKSRHAREMMDLEMDVKKREREIQQLQEDLRLCRADLERERETVSTLKTTISHQSNSQIALGTEKHALQSQKDALQMQLDTYLATISSLNLKLESSQKEVSSLKQEAMEAEIVRRKLHNMVQELKGNIRVFCRVRPVLPSDVDSPADSSSSNSTSLEHLKQEIQANMSYPDQFDHKEIVVLSSSESATGQERKEVYNFNFDRVFEPDSSQAEVFEEISLLAQSCVDGYNVCVFAYGQTGSGKSFTMEGGPTDTSAGMIPRAVEQVFRVSQELKSKGWEYKMEGQFLEIYNETINDLLGKGEFDKKKHEIKHDAKTSSTRVTDVNVVPLHSPTQVRSLLAVAQSRRTVAATLMNERSSRSHSVFTLRISGHNPSTGERCEGSLNLVDLAGSERLNASGTASDKDRLKETQSINRSLSALGDVVAALGEKGEKGDKHIPYRNSKLTYLLQNSLSGNSKTLMILNLSPLAVHLNESLTSLRFATKVNNTTIGTAKKQFRAS